LLSKVVVGRSGRSPVWLISQGFAILELDAVNEARVLVVLLGTIQPAKRPLDPKDNTLAMGVTFGALASLQVAMGEHTALLPDRELPLSMVQPPETC
jgi:hypothetical protein